MRSAPVVGVTGSLCIGFSTVVVGPALGAIVTTDLWPCGAAAAGTVSATVVSGTTTVVVVGARVEVVDEVVVVVTTVEPIRVALRVVYPAREAETVTVALPFAGKPDTVTVPFIRLTEPLVVDAENEKIEEKFPKA
ncbi:unannotated protein [freshwater metagenome]|uniref:Unannotated protein n=1 Tax=freshwater metagenome TaxID=449393 RepID=A0A6J7Q897_9ZZZZ